MLSDVELQYLTWSIQFGSVNFGGKTGILTTAEFLENLTAIFRTILGNKWPVSERKKLNRRDGKRDAMSHVLIRLCKIAIF